MNKINFIAFLVQLKKQKPKEILFLLLIGLSLTFLLSTWGISFKMAATKEAFGENIFLKYLVYALAILPFYFLVKNLFYKNYNGNNDFKNSILIYIFLIVILSTLIKIQVRKPLFNLQQDYTAYTVATKRSIDGIVEKGKGIFADDEIGEAPLNKVIENSVIQRTEKDELPLTNQDDNLYVQKTNYIYWQTPVLLGYNPKGTLVGSIGFKPHPIKSVKDFFGYLFQIVPVYYLEMLQKSLLTYSFLIITIVCILIYTVLKTTTSQSK